MFVDGEGKLLLPFILNNKLIDADEGYPDNNYIPSRGDPLFVFTL